MKNTMESSFLEVAASVLWVETTTQAGYLQGLTKWVKLTFTLLISPSYFSVPFFIVKIYSRSYYIYIYHTSSLLFPGNAND